MLMQKIGSIFSHRIALIINFMMSKNDVSRCRPVKIRDAVVLEDKRRCPIK